MWDNRIFLAYMAFLVALLVAYMWILGPGTENHLTEIRTECEAQGNEWAVVYTKNAAPKWFICLPHQSPVHIFEGAPEDEPR